MQKILELLQKAGCKAELVTAIGESLEEYKNTVREQFESDYTAKIKEAKKVCVEETENHKRELSRRLQIFLETKSAAIDAHLARQSALSESEAMTKLRNVKSLLEGVEVNGKPNNGEATAIAEEAKRKIQQLTEERNQAVQAANRQNAIAEKVLQRNRQLVTENNRLKAQGGNGGQTRETVTEGRGAPRGQTRRVDQSRRAAQPQTSRPTIVENQTRRPAEQPAAPQVRGAGYNVNDIAANMDEDLI